MVCVYMSEYILVLFLVSSLFCFTLFVFLFYLSVYFLRRGRKKAWSWKYGEMGDLGGDGGKLCIIYCKEITLVST